MRHPDHGSQRFDGGYPRPDAGGIDQDGAGSLDTGYERGTGHNKRGPASAGALAGLKDVCVTCGARPHLRLQLGRGFSLC